MKQEAERLKREEEEREKAIAAEQALALVVHLIFVISSEVAVSGDPGGQQTERKRSPAEGEGEREGREATKQRAACSGESETRQGQRMFLPRLMTDSQIRMKRRNWSSQKLRSLISKYLKRKSGSIHPLSISCSAHHDDFQGQDSTTYP